MKKQILALVLAVVAANMLAGCSDDINIPAVIPGYITIQGELFSVSLTELDLSGRALDNSDIEPLRYMVNLTSLMLWGNRISDVSALAGLVSLTNVGLGDNRISDVSPLAGLTNLTRLTLGGNQISDVSALAGLTNLTFLILGDNQISDVSALAGLTNLTTLDLALNSEIDAEQIAALRAALPNTGIRIDPEQALSAGDYQLSVQ